MKVRDLHVGLLTKRCFSLLTATSRPTQRLLGYY